MICGKRPPLAWLFTLGFLSLNSQAEEFSFSISDYEKKPYEISGYADLIATHLAVDNDASLSNLNFKPPDQPQDLTRYNGELSLTGLYRFVKGSVHFTGLSQWQRDELLEQTEHTLQELYLSDTPTNGWQFEIGKKSVKWGKGYAWNPVGFIERAKNPDDPELNREGYVMAMGEYTQTLSGPIKTMSSSIYLLPVNESFNETLIESNTEQDSAMLAAKLYLLIGETDLDFYLRHSSETSTDFGISFSSNLASNFEVHGDFAFRHQDYSVYLEDSTIKNKTEKAFQSLLGLRYLTETDTTLIAEWLHSPQGYSTPELELFYELAQSDPSLFPADYKLAQQAKANGYASNTPGQDYLYFRASQKDFADILYLNSAVTSIINLNDKSYTLAPELAYTGFKDSEIRLKATFLQGDKLTEFGEKLTDMKWELRARLFF